MCAQGCLVVEQSKERRPLLKVEFSLERGTRKRAGCPCGREAAFLEDHGSPGVTELSLGSLLQAPGATTATRGLPSSSQKATRRTLIGWMKQGLSSLGSRLFLPCACRLQPSSRGCPPPLPSQLLTVALDALPSLRFHRAGEGSPRGV